jgi:hypothetical protein
MPATIRDEADENNARIAVMSPSAPDHADLCAAGAHANWKFFVLSDDIVTLWSVTVSF